MSVVDGELLADIRCAWESVELFRAAGVASELWQQFVLVRGMHDAMHGEAARLRELRAQRMALVADEKICERLRGVQRRLGPIVDEMRTFCPRVPGAPEGERLELTLGFMMISPKALELAPRWLFDPAAWVDEAAEKFKAIGTVVDAYRQELDAGAGPPPSTKPVAAPMPDPEPVPPPAKEPADAPREAPRPEPAAAAPPAAPPAAKAPMPDRGTTIIKGTNGVHPDILEGLRCCIDLRALLEPTYPDVATWEVLSLVMTDRETALNAAKELQRLHDAGQDDDLGKARKALFERIELIRAKDGKLADDLRTFLASLQVGHFGKEVTEIALAFILAASRGRQRAQEWLESPQRYRAEATDRLEDLIRRAMTYDNALRNVVT